MDDYLRGYGEAAFNHHGVTDHYYPRNHDESSNYVVDNDATIEATVVVVKKTEPK